MCGDRAQGFYSARMKTAHDMAQHSGPRPRVPPHHGRELHGATSRFAYDRPQSSNNQIGNQPQLLLAKASHLYPAGKEGEAFGGSPSPLGGSGISISWSVAGLAASFEFWNLASLRGLTTTDDGLQRWLVGGMLSTTFPSPTTPKICIVSATVDGHSGRRRTWQNYKRR